MIAFWKLFIQVLKDESLLVREGARERFLIEVATVTIAVRTTHVPLMTPSQMPLHQITQTYHQTTAILTNLKLMMTVVKKSRHQSVVTESYSQWQLTVHHPKTVSSILKNQQSVR
jgi:hypothetical protein